MKAIVMLLLALSVNVYAQDIFHGCPMEGTAKTERLKELNRQKNRWDDVNPHFSINLKELITDTSRDMVGKATIIEGYVTIVKNGSVENCNCMAKDLQYRDTHIMLVADPKHPETKNGIIVEVTPRLRMKHKDWTTAELKKTILHHWVRVTGWVFFDEEHTNASENFDPGRKTNWRATPYEIHPVTAIEIIK